MILLFWLGVWQITAVCVDNFLLVVTPLQAFCWERFWDCC